MQTSAWPELGDITVLLGDPRMPDAAKPEGRFTAEDLDAVERLKTALTEIDAHRFTYLDDHESLIERIAALRPAFVLNFCDTGYRNDARREAHVSGLLELFSVPYSGAGPTCLGLCYDKATVRAVASAVGVPVPVELLVHRDELIHELADCALPALVKPATGDGSEGITEESVVYTLDALDARVRALRAAMPDRDVLVQEYLPGDEYAIGLIGNRGNFTVLPPLRVDYSGLDPSLPPILAYASKTDPNSPYWTDIRYAPASLPAPVRTELVQHATKLFDRVGCRDYARFDWRTDANGRIKLLELNPNPAWCWDGKMNLMAGFDGWTYADFLAAILDAALERVFGETVHR